MSWQAAMERRAKALAKSRETLMTSIYRSVGFAFPLATKEHKRYQRNTIMPPHIINLQQHLVWREIILLIWKWCYGPSLITGEEGMIFTSWKQRLDAHPSTEVG